MIIATSIILVFLVALLSVHNLYLRISAQNTGSVKATFLAEEGLEAMRFLRDVSWSANILSLIPDTEYRLVFESNTWKATTTNTFIDDIYDRVITLSLVYRDASDDIVASGGTLDSDTRLIRSSVSWKAGSATTTKFVSTYLSNILDE